MDEKDRIAVLLEYRCEELRRALKISEGRLATLTTETNRRERVIDILKLWEQENEIVDVKAFVKLLNQMSPLPRDVVELCLNNPTPHM